MNSTECWECRACHSHHTIKVLNLEKSTITIKSERASESRVWNGEISYVRVAYVETSCVFPGLLLVESAWRDCDSVSITITAWDFGVVHYTTSCDSLICVHYSIRDTKCSSISQVENTSLVSIVVLETRSSRWSFIAHDSNFYIIVSLDDTSIDTCIILEQTVLLI
jgi:hypothetical protein